MKMRHAYNVAHMPQALAAENGTLPNLHSLEGDAPYGADLTHVNGRLLVISGCQSEHRNEIGAHAHRVNTRSELHRNTTLVRDRDPERNLRATAVSDFGLDQFNHRNQPFALYSRGECYVFYNTLTIDLQKLVARPTTYRNTSDFCHFSRLTYFTGLLNVP